jgi:tRNA (guanine-N7-)-methyltransferase
VTEHHRKIKSFAIRAGRMTAGQAQAYEEMLPDFALDYSKNKINFAQLFGNDNPVIVEIGFGMGWSLAIQGLENPELNYLGVEVHTPGVGSLFSRMKENGATNIRVISHDAVEVFEHMISEASIQGVQLFFPDPWHKRKHHKRRIVKSEFIQTIRNRLKPQGFFHMATDWEDYAVHMLKEMKAETGWKNLSASDDYVPKPQSRPDTKFEKRGERLGHGVWDLMFEKV